MLPQAILLTLFAPSAFFPSFALAQSPELTVHAKARWTHMVYVNGDNANEQVRAFALPLPVPVDLSSLSPAS